MSGTSSSKRQSPSTASFAGNALAGNALATFERGTIRVRTTAREPITIHRASKSLAKWCFKPTDKTMRLSTPGRARIFLDGQKMPSFARSLIVDLVYFRWFGGAIQLDSRRAHKALGYHSCLTTFSWWPLAVRRSLPANANGLAPILSQCIPCDHRSGRCTAGQRTCLVRDHR